MSNTRNLHCIALRTVRHNDSTSILSVLSREEGRLSFVIPAGKGKSAGRLRALVSPGSRFTCVASDGHTRGLLRMNGVMPLGTPFMPDDPAKPAVLLFTVDVLGTAVRESAADPLLYDFCAGMFETLARGECRTADFHIVFLLRLTRFLGIEPDMGSWQPGYIFDMLGAEFLPSAPGHTEYLESAEAAIMPALSRMTLRNSRCYALSGITRNEILHKLLRYYMVHGILPGEPRSLAVVSALFGA